MPLTSLLKDKFYLILKKGDDGFAQTEECRFRFGKANCFGQNEARLGEFSTDKARRRDLKIADAAVLPVIADPF